MITSSSNRRLSKASFADVCTLESLIRHKWIAVALFLFGMIATGAFLFSRDRNFVSNARVFIRLGRESVTVDPTATAAGSMVQMNDSQKREIQSVIDIFNSNVMYEHIVDEVGVDQVLSFKEDKADQANEQAEPSSWMTSVKAQIPKLRDALTTLKLADPVNRRAKAISKLQKQIRIKSEADSNLVAVRVRSESPKLSQSIGNILLQHFEDLHLAAHRSAGAYSFFTEQVENARSDLQMAMDKLSDAKNKSALTSVADQRMILTEKLRGIELAMLTAHSDLQSTSAKTEDMQSTLDELPARMISTETVGLTNTSRDEMRGKLYVLEVELAELLSKFHVDHPSVIKKRDQLIESKAVYGEETVPPQTTTTSNPTRDAVKVQHLLAKADAAGSQARIAELENSKKQTLTEIRALNQSEAEIEAITRDVNVLDAKYRRYSESLEQSRIDGALQRDRLSSVNVIQKPTLEDHPVDLSNTIVTICGLFGSTLMALGAAFGTRYLRNDLANAEDVERELEIPVLSAIPDSRYRKVQLN